MEDEWLKEKREMRVRWMDGRGRRAGVPVDGRRGGGGGRRRMGGLGLGLGLAARSGPSVQSATMPATPPPLPDPPPPLQRPLPPQSSLCSSIACSPSRDTRPSPTSGFPASLDDRFTASSTRLWCTNFHPPSSHCSMPVVLPCPVLVIAFLGTPHSTLPACCISYSLGLSSPNQDGYATRWDTSRRPQVVRGNLQLTSRTPRS